MREYKYPNFEDWFDELERYSFRSERFRETMEMYGNENIEKIMPWLRAAFECGREWDTPEADWDGDRD